MWAGVVGFERPEDNDAVRPWICFPDTALDDWEEFVVANRHPKRTSRETIVKYNKYFAIEGRIAQRKPPHKTWEAVCPLDNKKQLALKKQEEAYEWDFKFVKIFLFPLEGVSAESLPNYEETSYPTM